MEKEKVILGILKMRLRKAKQRSIKLKKEFNITITDLQVLLKKQDYKCQLTGLPLTFTLGTGRVNTNISLDRKDSSKGYIKNNIQFVCMAVNQMKSDLEMEELKYFCKKILENEK